MERQICRNLVNLTKQIEKTCKRRTVLRNIYHQSNRNFSVSASQNTEEKAESTTHFGYQNVSKDEKVKKVHEVFENVAEKYDLMNDVMSAGVHRIWKDTFVARLNPKVNSNILDVAGGTGDISFRIADYIKRSDSSRLSINLPNMDSSQENPSPYNITVCDLTQNMLDVGESRANKMGYSNIKWICGNAQQLPFEDNSFDAYTIAYGIRNVVDIDEALQEAYRVLKPGGRFMCLEFSHVSNSLLRSVYDAYSFKMIPVMGQVFAGDWKSYQYLVESIRKFPDQETFKDMIEAVGFRKATYENLTFGVTSIHSGFKI